MINRLTFLPKIYASVGSNAQGSGSNQINFLISAPARAQAL